MVERERARTGEAWRLTPLWQRLATMRIGAQGARLTFAARLARENGWSARRAAAVVEEYRRFLYLAATAGPVTPSEDVDQAWHLHLSYTRHYWDVLCGEIFRQPLHHDPTEGGSAERARYHRQYKDTLARYRATFGAAPPPGIWPDAETRFAARPGRDDAGRYRFLPKARAGRLPLLAGAALLVATCTALAANSAGDVGWAIMFPILAVFAAAAGLVALAGRSPKRRQDDGGGSCGSCSSNSHNDGGGGCSSGGGGGGGCGGGCGGS